MPLCLHELSILKPFKYFHVMKNFFIAAIILAVLSGCSQKPNKKAALNGTIKGANIDSIEISYYQNDYLEDPIVRKVGLDDDQHFSTTLPANQIKRYTVKMASNQKTTVLLSPGWNVQLHAEMKEDQSMDTLYYKGDGGTENEIYSAIRSLSFKSYDYIREEPQTFIHALDSLEDKMSSLATTTEEELDQEFQSMIATDIRYNKIVRWKTYEQYAKRYNHNLHQPIVKKFDQKLTSNISLNKSELLKSTFYKSFLEDTLRTATMNNIDIDALRKKHTRQEDLSKAFSNIYVTELYNSIDSLIQNPEVKAHSYYHAMLRNMSIDRLDQLKEIFQNKFKQAVEDEQKQKIIENKFAKLERIAPGNPAPEFSYPDEKGNMVSLSDLRGQYVYLDIWATWCGPCVAEIPKLKELHEEYGEEIAFVSVSVDPKKEDWKGFLKRKELKGYQLYSGKNFDSEIIKDYMVQGIPRFVMIDPSGNILDVDAPRPSSEKTEKMMQEWTKKKPDRS